jgi:hypothetical protein
MSDWLKLIFPSCDQLTKDGMAYYGLLGDYVGGFFGTLAGAISVYFLYRSWNLTRAAYSRASTFEMIAEMLDTHEEIVASIKIYENIGRDSFVSLLSEFYAIYKIVNLAEASVALSIDQKIDISFTFMYYGTQSLTSVVLANYDIDLIKSVSDGITQERLSGDIKKRTFKGHQNRLSHYYRNIYSAFDFIDKSPLTQQEKKDLAKLYRTKLSNYEQALLALNIISHLGRPWETKRLLSKYQPIKNIPMAIFTFDRTKQFSLKKRFPCIEFEFEGHNEQKTWVWRKSFGKFYFFVQKLE